ncbi:Imm3 family immunity protein [Tumebacillus sp. DT12]|uniref:Imm3 family immunity protein n=1 Tax=Tumebacillus lacus TaxID=2995335 RepID=A0ABT3X0Q1_9BACL|nr:Imm3 family immunity protein [Tumebacillus lacus]MCX7569181.1 Imm3 family immunity protein [Tumebacillus lacus]
MEWEFDELHEAVKYRFLNTINSGRNGLVAAAVCFYEFDNVIEEGKAESLIFHTTLGKLCLDYGKIPDTYLEEILKVIDTFEPNELQGELTNEEITRLGNDVTLLKKELVTIEVIHDNDIEKY